ncbi:testosterone 17-beta-dehydrogenase 3 isoform X1 [Pimephales promelas]|uniref:testosterone 17-beta-dehydrogenase 3 isoform X1 n=1 Tax=Pimephales promelas TaxID=90988 RepID=UPI001955C194|nr:testosterone 17-beta-dehydrogenase 3 isoform X1 [Pimephales promelas]KAG1973892.1 testosterone 17-beta-dehydrogenase [Pimephales promelas]
MTLTEILFILTGTCTILVFGWKLVYLLMMLAPKLFCPLSESFFTSMGKWAVVTGGSDGIGRAYAEELSKLGMNVIIISRNQEKLDRAARKIELTTGGKVKVIAADFTKDDIHGHIKEIIEGLDIGILVNNVGILPSQIPCKLLETSNLEERIHAVINCNVKAMVKMCRIVLPGMQQRGKGVILNVSSGIAKIPCPLYTLYSASKVFVERFSQGLQAEYKSKGIIIQTVAPFGVSTSMTGHQKPDMVTFTAEEFVRSSLKYLRAGDQTYGSVTHTILGGIVQSIPTWVLHNEAFQHHFKEYVKERVES